MKTIMMILFLTAATVLSARSQIKQRFSLGPTAGFGHSWLSMDPDVGGKDSKFHSSYNVGAKLVYSIQNHWGMSADAKFSSEGGWANYIRIPLQGIYFFNDYGDKVRPKISFGPSFGFFVDGDSRVDVRGVTDHNIDSRDLFKTFDFGLNGAIGTNIRLSPATWLNADITYYHGLTNVSERSNIEWKNRNIGLNVGVLWGIGGGK